MKALGALSSDAQQACNFHILQSSSYAFSMQLFVENTLLG